MGQRPALTTPTEEQLADVIGRVLRWGVLTAATVVLFGGTLYLVRHGAKQPNYAAFRGEPSDLRSARGIIGDVRGGSSRGIIQLGVLILIATPVMRVALSLIGFARQRDWTYTIITLVVLALLLWSLFGARL